jgi:hypothetical protein
MQQVHLSEARVSSALDKLAHMETLVSAPSTAEPPTSSSLSATASSTARVRAKNKQPRRRLDVSGPVKPYNPSLKNFWYPVAFSSDLKAPDTMVTQHIIQRVCVCACSLNYLLTTYTCIQFSSGANRLLRGAVGDLPRQRRKARVCSEHMRPQGMPAASWFSERGQDPVPLPW